MVRGIWWAAKKVQQILCTRREPERLPLVHAELAVDGLFPLRQLPELLPRHRASKQVADGVAVVAPVPP